MPEYTIYESPSLAGSSGEFAYTQALINEAIMAALALAKKGQQLNDVYPRVYKHFHGAVHAEAPFFAFPLIESGVYDGSAKPGPDVVVFGSVAPDYHSAIYVGVFAAPTDGAHLGTAPAHPDTSVNQPAGGATASQFPTKDDTATLVAAETIPTPAGRTVLSVNDLVLATQD